MTSRIFFRAGAALLLLLSLFGTAAGVSAQTVDVPALYKNAIKATEEHRIGGIKNVQGVYENEIAPFKVAYDTGLAIAKKRRDDALNAAQAFYNTQFAVAETIADPKLKNAGKISARGTFTDSKNAAAQVYTQEVKSVKAGFEAQKRAPTEKLNKSKQDALNTFNAKKTVLDQAFSAYKAAVSVIETQRKTRLHAPEEAYKTALKNAEETKSKVLADAQKVFEAAKKSALSTFEADKANAGRTLDSIKKNVTDALKDVQKSAEDNFRISTGLYR